MKPARRFEVRIEQAVDQLAARAFPGKLHAAELTSKLVREAELAVTQHPTGPTAPNQFVVGLSVHDFDKAPSPAILAASIETAAIDRGWRLEGPVRVEFVSDTGLRSGLATIQTAIMEGPVPAWGELRTRIDPGRIPLAFNRILVGRSQRADAVIPHADLSRAHAVIWRGDGHIRIQDLSSTNGTYVNNHRIARPTTLVSGDVIAFGPVRCSLKVF